MAKGFPNVGVTTGLATDRTSMTGMVGGQYFFETDTKREWIYDAVAGRWVQSNQVSTTSGVNTVSNLIVPPSCQVRLTTSINPYTNNANIVWSSSSYDTDGMFTSGSNVTINTAGVYLISFVGLVTATATMTNITPVIVKNGSTLSQFSQTAISGTSHYWQFGLTANLDATNTIAANISINGGSAFVVSGNATEGNAQTRLSLTWLGRTS